MSVSPKSYWASFFLTLFLGPLGLLYSSIAGGLILLIVAIVTALTVFVPIICWVISIPLGLYTTYRHNKGVGNFLDAVRGGKQGGAVSAKSLSATASQEAMPEEKGP